MKKQTLQECLTVVKKIGEIGGWDTVTQELAIKIDELIDALNAHLSWHKEHDPLVAEHLSEEYDDKKEVNRECNNCGLLESTIRETKMVCLEGKTHSFGEPKQECTCKKPEGCRFLDANNEYDCIRCHDCGLPLPTNTKEEVKEEIIGVLEDYRDERVSNKELADTILALLVL